MSRVVTFSGLLVLAAAYTVLELRWLRFDEALGGMDTLHSLPTGNWDYLVLGVMISVLLVYEVAGVVQARRAGLTKVVSRLVALLAALVLLLLVLSISQVKWDLYLDGLEAAYAKSVPPDDG